MTDQALSPPESPRKSLLQRFQDGLAVYTHRPVLAIFLLGFSSGLPLALTAGTLTFWLSEVGVTRTEIGLFAAVATPYAFKFLWAPLMDRLPVPWLTALFGRRRSWLLVTQIATMIAIIGLGFSSPADDLWRTALFCVIVAFFSASQDIVVDAFRIESLEESEQGAGAAAYVWGYRIAMLLSGGGALALASFYSWQMAYMVMGFFMVIGMATVLWRREPREHDSEDVRERRAQVAQFLADRPHLQGATAEFLAFMNVAVIGPFAEFMRRKGWWLILLFIVFFKFGDAVAGIMTNPLYQEIGFTKLQVAGIVKSWGLAATLVGLGIGGAVMGALGMVRALWIAGILQMLSNLMFAALVKVGPDPAFLALTIGVENLAGGLGTAVFVAYLSSLCNISYTATQYALLSSFMAVARTWMSTSGGYFADELGWYTFFIATTFAAIPGLVLLWFVTRNGRPAEDAMP